MRRHGNSEPDRCSYDVLTVGIIATCGIYISTREQSAFYAYIAMIFSKESIRKISVFVLIIFVLRRMQILLLSSLFLRLYAGYTYTSTSAISENQTFHGRNSGSILTESSSGLRWLRATKVTTQRKN